MKKNLITTFFVMLLFFNQIFAQGPKLTITGLNPSFTKGTIDTEILTKIIQQKQEEVKKRVFRNTIIKEFNNTKYTETLRNFATYHYLYNLMEILTSGKNKTVITKSAIEYSTEFTYIFGLALFAKDDFITYTGLSTDGTTKTDNPKDDFIKSVRAIINIKNIDEVNVFLSKNVKQFNVFIDLCYYIILTDKESQNLFKFKENFNDKSFEQWFMSDNAYLLEKEKQKNNKIELDKLEKMKDGIQTGLHKLIAKTKDEKEISKNLIDFYNNLTKANSDDFSITQKQFTSMKYIINIFLEIAKNQYENDVVETVISTILENLILSEDEKDKNKNYLYMDIESLITSIDKKFSQPKGLSLGKYFQPFFSIGINSAYFPFTNNLLVNTDRTKNSMFYYASEKIGIKWLIYNWEYTHSFAPSEVIDYYGTRTYWKRPQSEPTISNIHLLIYCSGLLYNIADLKSNNDFKYAIIGSGIGLTFFNGLSANLSAACPFTDKSFKKNNMFFSIGFDIPIVEYISEISKNQ